MAYNSVILQPGVNTQQTQSLNTAGVWQSQLIRYKDGMIQSYGGWQNYGLTSPSTVRDTHAWQVLAGDKYLGVGATKNLLVYLSSINLREDITPQITTNTSTGITFSITSGSNQVTVNDPNSAASVYNTVYFNTPISLGTIFLSGAYPVQTVTSSGSYTINASANSTATVTSSGILPIFSLTNGSAIVSVLSPYSYYNSITGLFYPFLAPTVASSILTIQGNYQISQVLSTAGSSYTYTIGLTQLASANYNVTMSSGAPQLAYYITGSPTPLGSGFGAGYFGGSSSITSTGPYVGFGGTGTFAGITGTPIVTTDWSLDNWGDLLICCPENGPVYIWGESLGITTAQAVSQAPFFNGGLFVSQPQQILVLWRSCQITGAQNNLRVVWSNSLDYTNYAINNQTTAGGFQIPSGSIIVGGIQGPTYALISTDIEVWQMNYIGGLLIFNFTKVGSGCGWIGQHAAGILGGNIYWCGINNFFTMSSGGVVPIPCSVWDQIFQNISVANQSKVKCAVNSAFNEITWFYPSAASTGENDSYVKVTFDSNGGAEWDYGAMGRTSWIDITVLGMPIAPDASGTFYQHETGVTHAGISSPSFQTGWWALTDGEDFAFIDLIIPDFIWGLRSGAQDAQMSLTFFSANYPGDTPISYGPYIVTRTTEYINVRIRGRLMSVLVQSANNEFFRLGRIRYRYAPSGRR